MRTRSIVSIEKNPAHPDPTLLWYSRAVGIMRTKRMFADPTSWRFQGAIHDYNPDTDPYIDPKDPAPDTLLKTYGQQCQHSTWFFLPWHRMYLFIFEQIVAKAVVEAGGPSDWTLPYWDYNASDEARKLPWAFGQPTWPGGETNYLYIPRRAKGINEGTTALATADVDLSALTMEHFSTAPTASDVQFGGPRVKNHDGGTYPYGGIENSPHNHIHVAVGGPTGFMYDPTLAALDPIFWLHHSNIDRLWEVWIRETGRIDPTEDAWNKKVPFPFFDANKKRIKMTASQVVNTQKLGYTYEGIEPLAKRAVAKPAVPRGRISLLGATAKRFALLTDSRQVTIATHPDETKGAHERVLLHLENLAGKERPGSYDVYVNVPVGNAEENYPERMAGRVSLFGTRQADRNTRSHAREGFSFVLEITDIYRVLLAAGEWDPAHLQVTFKPVYDWSDTVTVGRVSVNVA